jgi:DNA-binding transcriptional regulator YiaG
MDPAKEHRRMTPTEIRELLALKGWSRTQLAAALDVTENTVHQWISGRRRSGSVRGPAVILMRMWLEEARASSGAAAAAS